MKKVTLMMCVMAVCFAMGCKSQKESTKTSEKEPVKLDGSSNFNK